MKVRLLELRNYRRHRHTTWEPGEGVIALLGRNGSGKSTLLEAIGFALFGVPATRTPRAKELLRWEGAPPGDPVQVTLELELDGHAIRVERELRGKNLTPNATLQVDGQVQVQPGGGSNDAVTQAMEKRLGMGRDAFFTTIVARQKELARLADESPADRKRLLLSMLGVDRVEHAIQKARQDRRGAEARAQAIESVLPDPKEIEAALAQAKQAVQAAENGHAEASEAWQEAKGRLAVAAQHLQDATTTDAKRQEAERRVQDALRTLGDLERRIQEETGRAAVAQEAAKQVTALAPQAARLPGLRRQLDAARQAMEAAKQREVLLAEVEAEKKALATLQEKRDAICMPPAPNGELEKVEGQVELLQKEVGQKREAVAVLQAQAQAVEGRLARIASLGDQATCPTCERPLEDHLPDLHDRMAKEREERKARLADAKTLLQERDAALADARKQLQQVEAWVEERRRTEATLAELDARIKETRARIGARRQQIPPEPEGPPDLEAIQGAVAQAEAAAKEHARAEARAEALPAIRQALAEAKEHHTKASKEEAAAKEALAAFPDTAKALADAQAAHQKAQAAERAAERRVHDAATALRLAQQQVQQEERRGAEAKAQREKLRAAREEARYWAALAGAQRDGLLDRFKDHLMARIGPAVSAEASRLLRRFTGGRYDEVLLDEDYQLFVGDGGVHYTLDRFSGGEADLVHLALRLAVSRLLVERSGGTDLRFLALDEVFGSLDRQRRGHVLAALGELRGLYSQVLLVTHQEGLQEALDHAVRVEDQDGEAVLRVANA